MQQIECETLKQFYTDKNMTIKEIAEALEVSAGYVHKMLHLYGITINRKFRKPYSKEIREQISKRNEGRKFSEETKQKMSDAKKIHTAGHKKLRRDGYISIYFPEHPSANASGYVMEHRYVMEQHIGRLLSDGEVVHHINKNRADNRIENLQLMTFNEHASFHMYERHEERRGN